MGVTEEAACCMFTPTPVPKADSPGRERGRPTQNSRTAWVLEGHKQHAALTPHSPVSCPQCRLALTPEVGN